MRRRREEWPAWPSCKPSIGDRFQTLRTRNRHRPQWRAVIVGSVGPRPLGVAAASQAEKVQFAFPEYPDVVIANIADVKSGKPIFFEYPQPGQKNMLVKIDRPAEEGDRPR